MKSTLLFLLIFLEGFLTSSASPIDSLSKSNDFQYVKPKLSAVLKLGGYLNANSSRTSFNSFKLDGHLELGVGENLSLNIGIENKESWTSYSNDLNAIAEIRYFIDPLYSLKSGASFSGTYIAPSFSYRLRAGNLNELPFSYQDDPGRNRPYKTNYSIGAKFGRQYQAFIDFGIFGGIENLQKQGGSVNSGILKTYSKLTVPIGNSEFNQLWRANLSQTVDKSYLLKFGINDVLSVSKKGFFFHPKLAYEQGLGKSGVSIGLSAEGYNYRAKFFNIEEGVVSEERFLRQYIAAMFSPELRYYLQHKKTKRSGSTLEGIYLKASAQVITGSEELKREYWEYEKFSSFNMGAGLGVQKMLMGGILLDTHFGVFSDNKVTNKFFFGGGIDLYWVK